MTRQEKINYIVEDRLVYNVDEHDNLLDFNEADVRASLDLMDESEMDKIISARSKAEALGAGYYDKGLNHAEGWEG